LGGEVWKRKMKPGRELDALIAEKVMGWSRNLDDKYGERPWKRPDGTQVVTDFLSAPCDMKMPKYSTDIAAAWQVAEKLKLCVWPTNKGRWFVFQEDFDEDYGDEYWFGGDSIDETVKTTRNGAVADTAALAICLSALKFLGIEI
jgi:hypothetical protein